jgi:CRISPR-associated protein Cmr1
MQALQVQLETVTPLFLGDADQQSELRPAAFRGALRFWLRALLGAHIGNDLKRLHEKESEVFGSTARASPIVLRVWGTLKVDDQFKLKKPGVQYLYFSMQPWKGQPRYPIAVNEQFSLKLQSRVGSNDHLVFKRACAALWLLVHLGGVGARSRRGAGNLRVVNIDVGAWPPDLPALICDSDSVQSYVDFLETGLKRLREATHLPVSQNAPSDFDVLHSQRCWLCMVEPAQESWSAVVHGIGDAMKKYRSHKNEGSSDYAAIRAAQPRNAHLGQVGRAGFGLPIVFYSRSTGPLGTLQPADQSRRASPLFIKVTRLPKMGKEDHLLQLLLFNSEVLPKGERIVLDKGHGRLVKGPVPDANMVIDFLQALSTSNYKPFDSARVREVLL